MDGDDRPPFDGLFGELFDRLQELDEQGELSGRLSDEGHIDIEYNIRTGLGPGAPGRKGHPRFNPPHDPTAAGETDTGADDEIVTNVNETPDGDYVVVADLLGTADGNYDVALDGSRVVIRADGERYTAVPVGADADHVGETTVTNSVLETRIHTA